MITASHVSFRYQDGPLALNDVSFSIERGSFVGIAGRSGAGKTTLTRALNGTVPHHYRGDFYGCLTIGGQDTAQTAPEQLSLMVGSVFQDIDGQMVASTVEDEILFGLENFGGVRFPREEIPGRMEIAMEKVGISHLRERSISSLSGGQKQKVAVASILALGPEVLVLDEPTGELDPQSSRQVFELLRALCRDYGITVIAVEQKTALLCEFAQKLMVLDQGRLVYFGAVRQVLQNSRHLEALGIPCPQVVSLALRLEEMGFSFGQTPVSVREAAQMIQEVLA